MSDPITIEAQRTAEIELLREELAHKDEQLIRQAELLRRHEQQNTIVPASEETTGDISKEAECANMLKRLDNLEARESERAGKLDQIIGALEALRIVDPESINRKLDALTAAVTGLPCNPNCPQHRSHLSSLPGGLGEK